MKYTIDCGSRGNHDNIIATVTAMTEFKVTFIGKDKMKPTSMHFEIDCDDVDHVIKTIKATIKATPYGKAIMFRVMPYGQLVYFAS